METMMKYILITGATSDIGKEICKTLENSGHHILMTDLSDNTLQETKAEMAVPDDHLALALDLSDVETAKEILSNFINNKHIAIEGIVFAAGILAIKPLRIIDYVTLKKSFDIALFSIFFISQLLISKKTNADNLKNIVMVSSVSAKMGTKGYTVYSAVKSAMLGLMRSMATELAPQVKVNAVLPGGIHTRTTDFMYKAQDTTDPHYLLGEGKTTDIANAIDFLLSDKARWITGQELIVDGGLTIN